MTARNLRIINYENREWFQFEFGHGDDFQSALNYVKSIPANQREWNPGFKFWRVLATESNTQLLVRCFENFKSELDLIKSQKELFA